MENALRWPIFKEILKTDRPGENPEKSEFRMKPLAGVNN